MKRLLLAACCFFLCLAASGQEQLPLRNTGEVPYRAGEKIKASLHYKWGIINADVGTLTFTVDTAYYKGKKVWHARCYGQSVRLVEAFFKLREDYQSWFTVDGLVPLRATRVSREGSYWANDVFEYDWRAGVIHAALENKSAGAFTKDLPVKMPIYDLPSIIYYARNADVTRLKPGTSYELPLAVDQGIVAIRLKYLGPDEVSVPGVGRIRAYKFACGTLKNETYSGEDAYLWFSADANRIPVYMELPIVKGFVRARLSGWEGLVAPMDALVSSAR